MSIYIYIYITKHTRNHIRNSAPPNTHPDDKRKMRTTKQKSQAQPGSETDRFIVYKQSKYCSFRPRVSGSTPGAGTCIRNHPRNSAPPLRKTKKTQNKLNIDALNDKTACDVTPNSPPFHHANKNSQFAIWWQGHFTYIYNRNFLICSCRLHSESLRNYAGDATERIS